MTRTTNRPVIAVIAAAGRGTRLGADVPKAFVDLRGESLIARSVRAMGEAGIDRIVVVVSPEMEPLAREQLAGVSVGFAHGGAERADSIWNALQSLSLVDATVVIHDAARALTPPAMIARVVEAVQAGAPAVVPVVPVADTVKVVEGSAVRSTPDRSTLRAVQTPQGFDLRTLRAANEAYFASPQDFTATDDASLMEWFGVPVRTVEGDPLAFKVTTPVDLLLAGALLDGGDRERKKFR